MPGNFAQYRCPDRHTVLIQRPIPHRPNEFVCPVCGKLQHYIKEVVVRGQEPVHGTYSAYTHGCHCDLCKEANRQYNQDRRDGRKRSTTKVTPSYRERAHDDLVKYMEQT